MKQISIRRLLLAAAILSAVSAQGSGVMSAMEECYDPTLQTIVYEYPAFFSSIFQTAATINNFFGGTNSLVINNPPQTIITSTILTTTVVTTATTTATVTTGAGVISATLGAGIPSGTVTTVPSTSPFALAYIVDSVGGRRPKGFAGGNGTETDADAATYFYLQNGELRSLAGAKVGRNESDLYAKIEASPYDNEITTVFSLVDGMLKWTSPDRGAAVFYECADGLYAGFPDAPFADCTQALIGGISASVIVDAESSGSSSTTTSGATTSGTSSSQSATSSSGSSTLLTTPGSSSSSSSGSASSTSPSSIGSSSGSSSSASSSASSSSASSSSASSSSASSVSSSSGSSSSSSTTESTSSTSVGGSSTSSAGSSSTSGSESSTSETISSTTSGSSTSDSGTTTTTSSAPSTTTSGAAEATCPADDGLVIGLYDILCAKGLVATNIGVPGQVASFQACIDLCTATETCVGLSYDRDGKFCYLHPEYSTIYANVGGNFDSAQLVQNEPVTTTTTTTSETSSAITTSSVDATTTSDAGSSTSSSSSLTTTSADVSSTTSTLSASTSSTDSTTSAATTTSTDGTSTTTSSAATTTTTTPVDSSEYDGLCETNVPNNGDTVGNYEVYCDSAVNGGNDLALPTGAAGPFTYQDCLEYCEADGRCTGFSQATTPNGDCYLHDGGNSVQPAGTQFRGGIKINAAGTLPGTTSTTTVAPAPTFSGNNGTPVPDPSGRGCTKCPGPDDETDISGNYVLITGFGIDGQNILGADPLNPVASLEDCILACDLTAGCVSLSYQTNPSTAQNCYLHSTCYSGTPNSNTDFTSAQVIPAACAAANSGTKKRQLRGGMKMY